MSMSNLIISVLIASATIAILTSSWIITWTLMEMNMISMALQLSKDPQKQNIIIFFVFQSVPSIAILVSITANWLPLEEENNSNMMNLVLMAMVCKMGMFPTHTWILKLSKSISWVNNFIMMSWQKIIPIVLMAKIYLTPLMNIMATLSISAMTILLLNSTNMKMFLTVSSMAHMSWIMMSISKTATTPLIYLLAYSMILILIVNHVMKMKSYKVNQQENSLKTNQMSMKINLVSLSGFPPLTGFFLKVMIMFTMIKHKVSTKMIMIMLVVATGTFYAYSQLMVKMLKMEPALNSNKKVNLMEKTKKSLMWNLLIPTALLMK